MIYLLDTNIVSYFLRQSSTHLTQRILNSRPDDLAISVLSLGELHYGLNRLGATRRAALLSDQLEILLQVVRVEALPPAAGLHYGALRTQLEAEGAPIGGNDLWIAAHALAAGMTLVTHNMREFKRVSTLKLENWMV